MGMHVSSRIVRQTAHPGHGRLIWAWDDAARQAPIARSCGGSPAQGRAWPLAAHTWAPQDDRTGMAQILNLTLPAPDLQKAALPESQWE